jgi:Zn-dependent M28 family amino/carboxypeptidase
VSTATYEVSADDNEPAPGIGRNVIAQTRNGNPDRLVMIGAHLDSEGLSSDDRKKIKLYLNVDMVGAS